MLHSRSLRYVDEVARHGSIRAAGARLHVAPSAINRQIIMLEDQLGEQLFERLPRGMRPTPAGELLIAHIRRTMQDYREAVSGMRALNALPSGDVTVATMSGLASSIVAVAATEFRRRYPAVRIAVRTMPLAEIHRAVADSEAEIGLGFNLPSAPSQLDVRWTSDTRLGAVMSASHPLARREAVSLAQCTAFPLIFADRAMVIHGLIAEAFAHASVPVDPAFTTNSIETMKRLATTGDAIAFLSRFDIVEEQREKALVFLPVRDRSLGDNVLTLVRRVASAHSIAATLLTDELASALERAAGAED